jgi:hypothetical protein
MWAKWGAPGVTFISMAAYAWVAPTFTTPWVLVIPVAAAALGGYYLAPKWRRNLILSSAIYLGFLGGMLLKSIYPGDGVYFFLFFGVLSPVGIVLLNVITWGASRVRHAERA